MVKNKGMTNYECEIEESIVNELKYKYGISNQEVLFRYLYLKFMSINNGINKNIDSHTYLQDLGKYILNTELGIVVDTYKGVNISYNSGFNNSIGNILESWFFSARMKTVITDDCDISYEFDEYINLIWGKIKKYGNNKSSKYKKDKYYKHHIIYNRLKKLNKLFGIKDIKSLRLINGFIQMDTYTHLNCEDKCERYIHASNFATNSISSIAEDELEKYIYKHLHLLEDGLKPVQRQLIVEEGRIDILAKDKNNNFVILELKVAEDKQLIWQVIYYPRAIEPIIKTKNVRIVTLCPSYPKHILNPLKAIKGVEIIQYIPLISNGKIEKMSFVKM